VRRPAGENCTLTLGGRFGGSELSEMHQEPP